ncbi:hypothetical protein ACOMHN_052866 [Nucella lapillus]
MKSQHKQLKIPAVNFTLSYFHNATDHNTGNQSSLTCQLIFFCPSFHFSSYRFEVKYLHQTCVQRNYVLMFNHMVWTGCEGDHDPLSRYAPQHEEYGSCHSITLHVNDVTKDYRVWLRVTQGEVASKGDQLEDVRLSEQLGYIQPVGYNPEAGVSYDQGFKHSLTLKVPENYTIMISLLHMDLTCETNERLSLYILTPRRHKRHTWSTCGNLPPLPEVLEEAAEVMVEVQFKDGPVWKAIELDRKRKFYQTDLSEGFRMLYTFLNTSSSSSSLPPQKVSQQRWNCSSSSWSAWRGHLWCNLRVECDAAQDESQCPHPLCAHGGFLLEGRCYLLARPARPLTYYDARGVCAGEGGYLASLNTRAEMDAVTRALWPRSRRQDFILGLTQTPREFDSMYRTLFQWDDQTIFYQPKVVYDQSTRRLQSQNIIPPFCGSMEDGYRKSVRMSYSCVEKRFLLYLCEFDSPSGSNKPDKDPNHQQQEEEQEEEPILLTNTSLSNHPPSPFPSVRCPENHWVPEFLACDLQSHCWGKNDVILETSRDVFTVMTSSWCAAPNVSEARYFLCSSSGERVPFTLVCDHHRDCFDGGDEDFCVHPPCPLSQPVPCGQVWG